MGVGAEIKEARDDDALAIAGACVTFGNAAYPGSHFEEVGRKFDRWIDVGYWQRRL